MAATAKVVRVEEDGDGPLLTWKHGAISSPECSARDLSKGTL